MNNNPKIYHGYEELESEEEIRNEGIAACICLIPLVLFMALVLVSIVRWIINV